MDWTKTNHDRAFDWIKSHIGSKIFLAAGSQKNYWYFAAHQAIINGCSPVTRLEFGLLDGGEFVAQFDPTTLAISHRQEGVNEAFAFELADPDYFWVAIATKFELLHTVDTSVH